MEPLELAHLMAQQAVDTKAKNLKILDLRDMVSYTDYFVLATATSDRHAQAISEKVYQKVKKDLKRLPLSYEGEGSGEWILLDYGDAVLHIFLADQRQFYGLDDLWRDAPRVHFFDPSAASVKRTSRQAKKPAKPRGKTKSKSKTKRKKSPGSKRRR